MANGRTVGRHAHLCAPDNGRTAGGTRGCCDIGSVPRGYGRVLALAMGAPARQEKGRLMLRKRIKQGLTALGLGTMLVLGVGAWGVASAASQAQVQSYVGQVREIKIDHCGLEPGTCAGSLVLAQARGHQVDLAIPVGTTIQRGNQRVLLEELGVGNYVMVQATPLSPSPQGNGRDWTWGEIDAYLRSPINSSTQGG
jgi:hypothetical protein